jgi:pimeloyl-ACP methyl ester carboxylesterase
MYLRKSEHEEKIAVRASVDSGQSGLDRPPWLDERLFPFRSHFLELGACKLHYVDEGEGPPLLLLHGNPPWSFLYQWKRGIKKLKELPVLVVWGDRDPTFRDVERARFERVFPKHRTVVLGGAGHFIQEDAADEIVEAGGVITDV